MSAGNLSLTLTPRFLDRVAHAEQYLGREQSIRGREFVAELFDFIYDIVLPFPLAFPAYRLPLYPDLPLRRAVFQRYYNVIYQVTATEIMFVAFFATVQDPRTIDL